MKQFLLAFLLLVSCKTMAQELRYNACSEEIINISKLYEKGNTQACAQACQTLLENQTLPTQCKWQAYRLLALAKLAEGDKPAAKKATESMLELNPTYKGSTLKDPADFHSLIQSISVIPKFSLGLAVAMGANFTYPRVSESYRLANYNKEYHNKNGYQLGISIAYFLAENSSLEINLLNTQKSYYLNYEMPNWKFEYTEMLNYLEFPVYFRQHFNKRSKLKPYLQGGAYVGTLIYSENSFSAYFEPEQINYSLEKTDSKNRRNMLSAGLSIGSGLSYKIKSGYLTLQVNYFHALTGITNEANRYNYPDLQTHYYYLDDQLFLNNLSLSIGFSYPINYKVIKE